MKDAMQLPFPIVPEDLLKSLDEVFPMKDFTQRVDQRDMDFYSGQRSVIRFLISKREEPTNNIIKTDETHYVYVNPQEARPATSSSAASSSRKEGEEAKQPLSAIDS